MHDVKTKTGIAKHKISGATIHILPENVNKIV
jgi:hypothetical protein